MQEARRVGGQVAFISEAYTGPYNRVDILSDGVKKLGEVGDQDVYDPVLEHGQVQLFVHCSHHLLKGHTPHTPHEAWAPESPLVYLRGQGIEGRRLQLRGEMVMPWRLASWTGGAGFLRSRVTRRRLPTSRQTRGLCMTPHSVCWSASVRWRYRVMSRQTSASVKRRSGPRALPNYTSRKWQGLA